MRQLIFLFLLCFGSLSLSQAGERPEAGRYIKAYSGGEGVVVWLLRVGPPASQESLVQIVGIDHKWDLRIQKLKREATQRGVKYVLDADGRRYDVLVMEEGTTELFIPGLRKADLRYDAQHSAQGNAEQFLTDYLEQK